MAFKMKNPSLMKMAKQAGSAMPMKQPMKMKKDPAMKLKKEEPMKMKKGPMTMKKGEAMKMKKDAAMKQKMKMVKVNGKSVPEFAADGEGPNDLKKG